ncbi:MAG: hypothetical protein ABJT31_11090 [Hyphomicrobiales bacterium]
MAAIADAASLCKRGTFAAALQSKSPERPFNMPVSHKISTVLSPQSLPALQSRDAPDMGAYKPVTAAEWLFGPQEF